MAKRKKTSHVKSRNWKLRNKVSTKRSKDHVPNGVFNMMDCATTEPEQNIDVLKQEEIEVTIVSDDDDASRNDTLRQTPVDEEVWVVRRQLCRGCHSDGAFWSLQTTTEGETYGHLLQTYFNIQLCPVSADSPALSAICTLCAARLREARAFSAQARAAEERFTRLYKQNRVRALVNEVVIEKDPPKIKNEVDDFEIIYHVFDNVDDVEQDTANSNFDNLEPSIDELAPTINNNKKTQELCKKPSSKNLFRLSPSDYEREGNLFKCTRSQCGRKLYNRRGIYIHVKNVHLKSPSKPKVAITPVYHLSPSDYERVGDSIKCARCDKQFNSVNRLRIHIKSLHMNIHKYTCTLCSETFRTLPPFIKHKLDEHSIDDRLKCNACDRTFNSRGQFVNHKNSFHMLGVKHVCPNCDYECFTSEAMYKHKFKHKSVKDYQCKFCRKLFLRKTTLVLHERIHTGDRRKVCNECGQAFVQKASLNYHMTKYHPEVQF